MQHRKKALPLAAGILLVILYFVIFNFSGQDGEESGSISKKVSMSSVKLWDKIANKNMSESMIEEKAENIELPIRKLAHFSEYTLMGILVFCILYYPVPKNRRRFLFILLWVFLSAALDEFHQSFIPGRSDSFLDVLLDTGGGAFGALVCVAFTGLHLRKVRGSFIKVINE